MTITRNGWRAAELLRACDPLVGHAGYRTREQEIAIPGTPGLRIRALHDRNQFHDPQGLAAALGIADAAWPLFGWPWASGIELATQVAARRPVAGERMLEVGCGLALASLTAHRLGRDVTASDLHPLTARFLARNLRLNALGPMKYRQGRWQDPMQCGPAAAPGPAADSRRRVRGRFAFVVGSDVLYERDAAHDLAAFVLGHAAPLAEVWIVDPDRGNRSVFRRRLQAEGFVLSEHRLDRLQQAGRPGYKGRLMRFVRA